MRIFLDANILFSAAKTDGAIRRLLALLKDHDHECRVDAFVLEEARRNLATKSPQALDTLTSLSALWREAPTLPPVAGYPKVIALPDKDLPVLAAAIHNRCEALVTGDRSHFGPFYGRTLHGVAIHSPRSIADLLLI